MIHGGLSGFSSRYYLKYMKCNGIGPHVVTTILILKVMPPPISDVLHAIAKHVHPDLTEVELKRFLSHSGRV
jgi:hypothetical protein